MCVLLALVDRCGQLIPSAELQDRFWPNSYSAEHGLHKAISEIRTAFGDDPKSPRYVKTFSRRGYSFIRQDEDQPPSAGTGPEARGHHDRSTAPPNASVAVLPFVNIGGDPDNEYFSDGLTEELLNVLSNIKELKVAARTSSFHFKGRTGNVADIARQLGVATILEGSVRQSSTRIRITAQLINAADGYHLWSETFDRILDDIFAVQDEIASAVAKSLKVKLLGKDDDRPTVGGGKTLLEVYIFDFDAEIYGTYITVRFKQRLRSEENFASIEAMQRQMQLDVEAAKAALDRRIA